MTLIVGILCQDGIVLGADGAASLGALGQMTARQSIKKLSLVHDCMIVGVSGPVGLAQRINGMFGKLYEDKKLSGKKPFEAMGIMRQPLWTDCIEPEMRIAAQAQSVIGAGLASKDAICGTLVAIPIAKELCLFQFDQQGAPEMASKDLPFAAIGSGQHGADQFLSFLRRIFWQERQPNLAEGIFATQWTLDHAIKTSPGGVADPIQITVLEFKNGAAACRELGKDELVSHQEAVTNAENYLRGFNVKNLPRILQTIPSPNPERIPSP